MEGFILFIHIFASLLLIIVVLLQSGKSADLAGAFGGAGTQSTFGPRGAASFLSKMTTTLAIIFMATSLFLYIIGSKKASTQSVVGKEEAKQGQTVDKKEGVDKKKETKESTDKSTTDDSSKKTETQKKDKKDNKPETSK